MTDDVMAIRLEARTQPVCILVDGEEISAFLGETIAVALLAAGKGTLRTSANTGQPRGMFCGMGVCRECLVTVDGQANVRACMRGVAEGMRVETEQRAH